VELPAPALTSYPEERSPWRKAAIVSAGIAAIELVVLVVIALAFIAKPFAHDGARTAKPDAGKPVATTPADKPTTTTGAKPAPPAAAVAKLPRSRTTVLVLNGNGVSGAASSAAARIQALHYRITGVADAAQPIFPRTIVMYRPGFRGEAQRLARDLGLSVTRAVPLDGMRPADLGGAKLALVVGG
jgi:hypothetical protein